MNPQQKAEEIEREFKKDDNVNAVGFITLRQYTEAILSCYEDEKMRLNDYLLSLRGLAVVQVRDENGMMISFVTYFPALHKMIIKKVKELKDIDLAISKLKHLLGEK